MRGENDWRGRARMGRRHYSLLGRIPQTRFLCHSFNGNVTFQKEFVNVDDEDNVYSDNGGDAIYDDITFIPLNIPRYTITLARLQPSPSGDYPLTSKGRRRGRTFRPQWLPCDKRNGEDRGWSTLRYINEDYEDGDVWSFIMPAQNVIVSAVATREKFFIRWDQNEGIDIDEADWDNLYTPGSTISFTIDMEEYLQVQSARYCYTDDEGYHEVNCTKDANGSYSFIMPAHDVTIKAPRQQIAFNIHYDTNKMKVSSDPVVIDEDYYKTDQRSPSATSTFPMV